MTFVIVILMYQSWVGAASLAFWIFIAAGVSDWLDGYLARKQKLVSNFGKFMDALTDKILVIGLLVALLDRGMIVPSQGVWPVLLVVVTIGREFMVSGMRMVAASKGVVVQADGGGKTKTMTQLIAIGFLLAAPMVELDWARWVTWELAGLVRVVEQVGWVGFLIGTLLAVWSGYRYISKNWRLMVD